MFKHHTAKTALDKALSSMLFDDADECTDAVEDLHDYTENHNDSDILGISGWKISGMGFDAFGCDNEQGRKYQRLLIEYIKIFMQRYNITIKQLSNEAQKQFCQILIKVAPVSEKEKELKKTELDGIESPALEMVDMLMYHLY